VLAALEGQRVDPSRLVLELTEAVVLQLSRRARRDLEALDDAGVRLFVDDFGTGYGALAVFDDLPVRGVKLDRSLVNGARPDERGEQLLLGLRHLVDGLGIVGVVEGIETTAELDRVRDLGWAHGQGYLLGAPAPLDA
jgi:EAL domain-containing protein (putative c-di-GMP-specific phosphodiesterase class I)